MLFQARPQRGKAGLDRAIAVARSGVEPSTRTARHDGVTHDFEWDPRKARSNLAKHGIGFDEAETAIDDPWAIVTLDEAHSVLELSWRTIGLTRCGRLGSVVWTWRGDRIRIVTARPATRRERHIYEAR